MIGDRLNDMTCILDDHFHCLRHTVPNANKTAASVPLHIVHVLMQDFDRLHTLISR
jgi:hypothetical protein